MTEMLSELPQDKQAERSRFNLDIRAEQIADGVFSVTAVVEQTDPFGNRSRSESFTQVKAETGLMASKIVAAGLALNNVKSAPEFTQKVYDWLINND